MKSAILGLLSLAALTAYAAEEHSVNFVPAKPDPLVGDWDSAGAPGKYVGQLAVDSHGDYRFNLLTGFDVESNLVATLRGTRRDDEVSLRGGGWSAVIKDGAATVQKEGEKVNLKHAVRAPHSLDVPPPAGAVVLFDGNNLDAWAKKKSREWLVEDGPAQWKIVDGKAMEVVPESDCLISKKKLGDGHAHVEFRTLGKPTNSGVFFETRYEVNINETYGETEGTPCGGLDNCTPSTAKPKIRASRPPLEWQTLDVDFRAPRFDGERKKIEAARATVMLNGALLYRDMQLNPPKGAASRLGEAPTGPLMLQEHGMPIQFRNIWFLEK